ncbi:MAG: 16S rRNA (cytosine(1402)-N(4))-methyltransferase RsmH [Chloroflexi bacterium]|nr:16S rRNA (cytosine(1402)-N(4))-methyltransferase RsmH [Chloroflexota bacterium]MCL5274225.1 16S rRNA (cytosine(1402)-N(4))-methyltransferase RsmH [Chloroflexota bacterium]
MHTPVLFGEVINALKPGTGGCYLDVTVGGGGHAEGILEASAPDGRVLGTDADARAIQQAAERLSRFGPRVVLRQAWLDEAPSVARQLGFKGFDGILADLGLSSNQLDDPTRGFAFMRDGPLDMRFDSSRGVSAATLINTSDVNGLTQLLREYGEVERARQVAEAIWEARPLTTTAQLRDAVAGVARSRGRIHPATQVFQALRIAVNDELRRLREALPLLLEILAPGGRLAVITFHSLEDRIVKQAFRDATMNMEPQPGFGQGQSLHAMALPVNRKPITASQEEIAANPRARSAKVRVVEKLS